jgi:Transmembrane secretion effector
MSSATSLSLLMERSQTRRQHDYSTGALACLVAAGGAFFDPARAAAVSEMLPKDHLVRGNALDGLFASLTVTVTWGLSGVLVAALGPATSLCLDAGTFLVSFCLIAAARWDGTSRPTQHAVLAEALQAARVDVLEGVHWVRQDTLVRTLLMAQGAYMLVAAFFFTDLVPFLQHHLHGGAALYGWQGAAFGAGIISASWLIGLRPPRKIGRLYCLGLVVNGVGNSLFALAPSVWYLLPAVFLAGAGRAAYATGERTMLQVHVPLFVRRRVFVLWGAVAPLVWTPALVLGGWVADHAPAQLVLLSASGIHVGIGLWLRSLAVVTHAESA